MARQLDRGDSRRQTLGSVRTDHDRDRSRGRGLDREAQRQGAHPLLHGAVALKFPAKSVKWRKKLFAKNNRQRLFFSEVKKLKMFLN